MAKNSKGLKNLWDIKKTFMYIKVGIFFLIAFILFFVTIISIREVDVFKGSYVITVTFDFVEGLKPSSPVRFCGVDVGEVKKLTVKEYNGRPLVYVQAKVQNDIKIPNDSYFFVNSLSLFGEKYLEIDPPEETVSYLQKGQVVEGISPIPLFGIFATFTKTMNEVREFVKEGKLKSSLENIVTNIEDITFEVKGLVEDIKNKEGAIGRLLYDDSLYQTTEEFISDLKAHPWKLLHKPKERRKRR